LGFFDTAQTTPPLCHNLYLAYLVGKGSPNIRVINVIFIKTVQSKEATDGRKFAQSCHPAQAEADKPQSCLAGGFKFFM
jgi:hypothetical protein